MNFVRFFSGVKGEFLPSSRVKVYRKAKVGGNVSKPAEYVPKKRLAVQQVAKIPPHVENAIPQKATTQGHAAQQPITVSTKKEPRPRESTFVENEAKIQMIPQTLHDQIFGKNTRKAQIDHEASESCVRELQHHGIQVESTEHMQPVDLKLPPLCGKNIEEHFYNVAKAQIEPYEKLLLPMVEIAASQLPPRPAMWNFQPGWTRYDSENGAACSVEYPKESCLVFDVEVCVPEGAAPVMATAYGLRHWYSWVSERLTDPHRRSTAKQANGLPHYSLGDLIPLGEQSGDGARLVIGHNVSYDRARIREQYLLEDTGTRFLDTMSLHVCVSGISSFQRAMLKSKKEPAPEDTEWMGQSSLNSLAEVHKLYCGGEELQKELRNVFVEGSMTEVRQDFQNLMTYCANDVSATHRVLQKLYPLFQERFPHPVTLAGMMEINSAYLPVNSDWLRYIEEANLAYEDLSIEAKYHLAKRADEACSLQHNEQYKHHLWLWDEDWSTQQFKMKAAKTTKKAIKERDEAKEQQQLAPAAGERQRLQQKFQYLYDMQSQLPARRPLLPGYPTWYRKLCCKPPKASDDDADWQPGATEISTGMQVAAKLLSLNWEGYPLHYMREHGWGFLVPFRRLTKDPDCRIPIEQLAATCPILEFGPEATATESAYTFGKLQKSLEVELGKREFFSKSRKDKTEGQYTGSGVWCNQIISDCCFFLKLPHKNGRSYRVGNPLSRDFLNKFSENVLSSGEPDGGSAARVIEIARMMSYWRNNRDRIMGQMVVWLPQEPGSPTLGAICPQVVTCGTLTRRAMEPTWLTASNSQRDRIGSELRAMVQAPAGYKIVGADVDSQELWIASVLGDAYANGIHGGTPLGWMTLSGSKSNGTDMHSVTAKAVGISRDHAKVINYARIYGAGQNFAEGLLKQFNPTFSDSEAKSKAMKMFAITKGKRTFRLRKEFRDQFDAINYTRYEAFKMAVSHNRSVDEMFHRPRWVGGTESAMFNRLEEIATTAEPVTPFLGCRLSRALETSDINEGRFLPTRVNWVVQSGAVDFLHLMLVSMRWLMGQHVRFCLSFHDEIRYLVADDKAYPAALAMHLTNLLTRSFCSSRIGLNDLPMSVAFFSSVEVDTVLRKEGTMDCKTPSNPHGLQIGYGIPAGESVDIYKALEKAGGGDVSKWPWIR